jgi:hypothetical protein
MTLKEAERILDGFISSMAISLGFKRRNETFERLEHEATAQLSFPCCISGRGTGLFSIGIGLRFDSLAELLDEYPEEMQSTIGMPIHFLRKDNKYTEWEFSNANDLEKLRGTILEDIENHAFPYLERYSQISELQKALESPNKHDWVRTGLNIDSRVTVLAAIQSVEGDRISAIKTLDEGLDNLEIILAGRSHVLRKRRFAMEYLRGRLIAEK